jgi:hypothetical protein
MKGKIAAFLCFIVLALAAAAAGAGDFEWLKELNVRATADPSGFRASLATRFNIGPAEVSAVIGEVDEPGDAYMALKLSEMSGQPVERVTDTYRTGKTQGWGALARKLGIKPGSPEFHALKKGHDLDSGGKGKGKGKKEKKRR